MNNEFNAQEYSDLHRSLIVHISNAYSFDSVFVDDISKAIQDNVNLDLSTMTLLNTRTINSQFLSQFDADIYIKSTVAGKDLIIATIRQVLDNSFYDIKDYVTGDGNTIVGKGLITNLQLKRLGNQDDYFIVQFNIQTTYNF